MPVRRVTAIVSPFIHFVEWLFSEPAPGVDLFLGLLGTGWLFLMLRHPEIFDAGNFVGMQWLPDQGWIGFITITTSLHYLGLARLTAHKLRVRSMLLSSWFWLTVAISLARIGWSTGVINYGLVGIAALFTAIYLSGRIRQGA